MSPTTSRAALEDLDVDSIRFSLERTLMEELEAWPDFERHKKMLVPSDPAEVRRRLLGDALRLTESMAPAAYEYAREAKRVLGVDGELELYQSAGRENASLHLVQAPILLEIQGRMLSLLDDGAGPALFGHELGHYLAHGPWTEAGATSFAGVALAQAGLLTPAREDLARRLSVAREVTADRFGLLACQDLDAALRLEMIATTGLSGDALTWDTRAYLDQCRELMEATASAGKDALATTHPEHSLRAWALWLFSETKEYWQLSGKGPGTRSLADVDAQIAKVLGASRLAGVFDMRDEPPEFLLECALACAVLVANADGEVAPEEVDAIEDMFSRSVPGWSELLDVDVALERFYETGGLVAAAGSDLARRLFLLMAHVMAADGVVDAREVQMILSIGEALGFAKEFRSWIEPTVAALGGSVEVELDEPVAIPLPARKGEIREALSAFCDTVQRQGAARISPRRLLRIAGAEPGNTTAVERIEKALEKREISVEPPLSTCGADDIMVLRAAKKVEVAAEPPAELDDVRRSVISGLARLRDELISGDGRSPSIRLRRAYSGRAFDLVRLDAVRTGAAERALTLVRSGKAATLITPSDAGRHDAAQACVEDLRRLDRANIDRFEETGANDLYLGYPIMVGNVAPRGSKGVGYGVRAPLVLYPCKLERDGRGARGFSIRPRTEEEPLTNRSLLRLVFDKADLAMPDELLTELDGLVADPGEDVPALIAKLAEVGLRLETEGTTLGKYKERDDDLDAKPPFLAIEECALLGLFPQSSSDLLQDYDALLTELQKPDRTLDDLLAAGAWLLPAALQPEAAPSESAAAGWPVVDADPSQREVVSECGRNRVTVIDGPPGTGKSQVIVNLVADALRRGERVAVVAEKRAALDVVHQRLQTLGLGDAAAVVHDVRDDRKALFGRLGARLASFEPRKANGTRLDVLRSDYQRSEQTLETRRSLIGHVKPGAELTIGQLFALCAAGPAIEGPEAFADLPLQQLRSILELAERLHPYADLWGPDSWWRSQHDGARPGLHEVDDAGLATLLERIRSATDVADATLAKLEQEPAEPDALLAAGDALVKLRRLVDDAPGHEERELLAAVVSHPQADPADVDAQWNEHSTALAKWNEPTELAEDDALARDASILQSYAGRFGRFFSLTWWRARGGLRRTLAQAWPERAGAGFDAGFLQEVQDKVAATRTWRTTKSLFEQLEVPHLAPKREQDARAKLDKLVAQARNVAELRRVTSSLGALGLELPSTREQVDALGSKLEVREQQRVAVGEQREATAPFADAFPWAVDASGDRLRELRTRLEVDGHRLREADGLMQRLSEVHAQASTALDRLATEHATADGARWREALARAWASAQLAGLRKAMPQLETLGTTADAQTVTRSSEAMRKLDKEIRELEVGTIQAQLDGAELLTIPDAKYRARRTPAQRLKEQIVKEVGKSRRLMPLRQFVRTFAPDGLLDAMPCWLVSPETMAVLFPRQPLFDLVVFDEASQCTVEAGFPVTLRAKRVVVAGDDKQMPPTRFFEAGASATEDEDLSEEEIEARDAFAAESLLVLARNRCPHIGLKWHYRCRYEELIAYSNHSMYDGELLTIPSTAGPRAAAALKWIEVPDGQYDAGLNRPEARRVVELLHELLSRKEAPTVGVVTFNLKQRQTIFDAIETRSAEDAEFAKLWSTATTAEAVDDRPFVKNLESVQGDERDVIVFSLGHAPVQRRRKKGTAELYVPARFGPLGQRGGERRLNVAISRAKKECFVVSSFDPRLLHVGETRHSGPRLFKGYLEFAHAKSQGRHDQADRILDDVRETRLSDGIVQRRRLMDGHLPLAAQIALELEGRGITCAQGLGSSQFRIPLAVAGSGADDGAYSLAILTDEGGTGTSALDQFVHRPLVLGLRGWDVMHVDAASWHRRRVEILDRIAERVGLAEAAQ